MTISFDTKKGVAKMTHAANNDIDTLKFRETADRLFRARRLFINEKTLQKNPLDIRRGPQVEVACETETTSQRHR
jgi:hypothetical protein